ncbi:MAG: F0F1 ATP synthase subunit delta [Sphingomonadales bacterium]|nr:F0F1 ATP synthase subunit delta [Sphingomonadales bacterium]
MENSGGMQANIQASLGGRYATALFDLANERGALDAVETSIAKLAAALDESADLRALIANPMVSRAQAGRALAAIAKTLTLDALTTNFLGVISGNRRLGDLPAMLRAFKALVAHYRGEVAAEVTSARPLDSAQVAALKAKLKARVGSDVTLSQKTDPDILGGLVVKIGSQMIDSSIRTRLNTLALAMKG